MKLKHIEEANELRKRLRVAIKIEKALEGDCTYVSFFKLPSTYMSTGILRNAFGLEIERLNAQLEKLGVEL